MYDLAVFIGRFQPFHNGHLHIVNEGLKIAQKVLILVGSANTCARPRNPWSFSERARMIRDSIPADVPKSRVLIVPSYDKLYDNALWAEGVVNNVEFHAERGSVVLLGHKKDATTFYLDLFPQWAKHFVEPANSINATHIRADLFEHYCIPDRRSVPNGTAQFLIEWSVTPASIQQRAEWEFARNYKIQHDSGQFHRNNVCVDAVVINEFNELLVIRRGYMPGKGLLALPGGHVNRDEKVMDASARELKEETGLDLPACSFIVGGYYDDPNRSDLCRCYSFAYMYRVIKNSVNIKAGDDAAEAFWLPIGQLDESQFFNDHYQIIQDLLRNET